MTADEVTVPPSRASSAATFGLNGRAPLLGCAEPRFDVDRYAAFWVEADVAHGEVSDLAEPAPDTDQQTNDRVVATGYQIVALAAADDGAKLLDLEHW